MSETEDLKKKTQEAYVEQRLGDLEKYMDRLFAELATAHGARRKHALMTMSVMATFLSAGFGTTFAGSTWAIWNFSAAAALFYLTIAIEWLAIVPRYMGLIDELRGCIKTLEVLGMVDKRDRGDHRLGGKYTKTWIYKVWTALKSNRVQQGIWAPQKA